MFFHDSVSDVPLVASCIIHRQQDLTDLLICVWGCGVLGCGVWVCLKTTPAHRLAVMTTHKHTHYWCLRHISLYSSHTQMIHWIVGLCGKVFFSLCLCVVHVSTRERVKRAMGGESKNESWAMKILLIHLKRWQFCPLFRKHSGLQTRRTEFLFST